MSLCCVGVSMATGDVKMMSQKLRKGVKNVRETFAMVIEKGNIEREESDREWESEKKKRFRERERERERVMFLLLYISLSLSLGLTPVPSSPSPPPPPPPPLRSWEADIGSSGSISLCPRHSIPLSI